jgi:hypothetical protein
MRIIITHARFGNAVSVDLPAHSTRQERNQVRQVLRNAERGRLAGRDE